MKTLLRLIVPCNLFLLSAFPQFVSASQSYELDSVVTTGTRTPKLLKDSPVSVEVISSEQLAVLSSGTLAEALNFIPGVVLTRSTKDGYNIQMQGFGGDRVLVLLNGQRLISPTGSSADLDQITAADIERIEVMRGAGSVLYGSAAMGGVINIITQSIERSSSKVGYEVGSYTNNAISDDPLEHRVSVSAVSGDELLQHRFSYQHMNKPGFKYDQNSEPEIGTSNEKHFLEGDVVVDTGFGHLNYRAEYLKENRYRQEESEEFSGIGRVEDAYFSEVNRLSQSLDLNLGNSFKFLGNYALHDESSGRVSAADREATIGVGGFGLQTVFMPEGMELVSGLEYDVESMDITDDGITNEFRESIQGYSQLDIFLTDDVELLAGLRVQHDSGFGFHHAGRVSAKLQQQFHDGSFFRLRFGLGESYKVPTLKQLHYLLDHISIGNYVVIGNENLKPEESSSINIDSTFEWVSGSSIELSAYYTEATNLIENEFSTDPELQDTWGRTTLIYVYQNISEVEISGANLAVKKYFNNGNIAGLNYAYVDAKEVDGDRLNNRPRHQVKLNYQSSFSWLESKLIAYAVYQADEAFSVDDPATSDDEGFSGEHNNEWISLNLAVTHKPSKDFTLRYGIQNILDEHKNMDVSEELFDSRDEDSRRIYFGITYEL